MTPTPDQTTLIRQAKDATGWGTHQLAAELGVSPRAVKYWQSGGRRMPEPVAKLLRMLARKDW